jgi:toxin-antitoxin system PIN domain toxin
VKTALLDVNILTALLWPAHEHHGRAHRWFGCSGDAGWATCCLTQLGFVRIVSNPAFSSDALSPAAAVEPLAMNLSHGAHEFWTESRPVPAALRGMETGLQGYKQLTDAYLLALASRRNGALATFDRGVRDIAGVTFESSLEVVPAR